MEFAQLILPYPYILYLLYFCRDKTLFTIQGIYIVAALLDISWFFFGIEKFKTTVTGNTIIKICTVVCIFLFVRTRNDLAKYVFIMALGTLLSQAYLWFFVFREVKLVKPSSKEMLVHLKPMLLLFIPVIAISLYKMMDKVMLGSLSNKVEVGYYNNAEKAIDIPISVIGAFGTVMLPKMSTLMKNGVTQAGRKYMELSVKYIMLIAMALTFGIAAVSFVFSEVFWGSEFIPCGSIIRCLSISIPFLAFANILRTQYLIPLEKDKEYIISVFAGAIVNLIINTILIPKYNALGAAIGTVFAEAAVCITQALFVKKDISIKSQIKNMLLYVFFGIIMYFAIDVAFKDASISITTLCLQMIFGGTVYLIISVIYLAFAKDEVTGDYLKKLRAFIHK